MEVVIFLNIRIFPQQYFGIKQNLMLSSLHSQNGKN